MIESADIDGGGGGGRRERRQTRRRKTSTTRNKGLEEDVQRTAVESLPRHLRLFPLWTVGRDKGGIEVDVKAKGSEGRANICRDEVGHKQVSRVCVKVASRTVLLPVQSMASDLGCATVFDTRHRAKVSGEVGGLSCFNPGIRGRAERILVVVKSPLFA